MKFCAHLEDWELVQPFRISGMEWITSPTLVVQVEEDGCVGRGEAQGVFYLDETAAGLFEQVDRIAPEIRKGITREELQHLLPAGGARNAIDCALWDLECKKAGKTIWQLTGIDPKPVTTVFTIGLEPTPEEMAAKAAAAASPARSDHDSSRGNPSSALGGIRWSFSHTMSQNPSRSAAIQMSRSVGQSVSWPHALNEYLTAGGGRGRR